MSVLKNAFGGIAALHGVSLVFEAATIVALIGPNGSGKTTLFNLLAGRLRPSAGAVQWRGQDITAWPPHRRCRAGISRTFQVAQPFLNLSLAENVALGILYGAPAATSGRRDAMAQVGAGPNHRPGAGHRVAELARAEAGVAEHDVAFRRAFGRSGVRLFGCSRNTRTIEFPSAFFPELPNSRTAELRNAFQRGNGVHHGIQAAHRIAEP